MGKGSKQKATAEKESLGQFFRSAYAELKKVHAPTREETVRTTIVVVIMMIFFAFFLSVADYGVGRIMTAVLT